MERLVKDLLSSPVIPQTFPAEEVEAARTSILSLSSIVPKLQSTLRVGVEQLFNQLLRPKLRTLLADVYKDVSYVLDDDAYAAAEYQDVVRKRFIRAWEGLAEGYKVRCGVIETFKNVDLIRMMLKDTLTENNYRLFFGLALDVLIRPWEKLVLGQKYNEVLPTFPSLFAQDTFYKLTSLFSLTSQLGAVRFDRDLRAITTYLSSQTAFGDVRDKFVRLQQIATLLNLDQVCLCFGSSFYSLYLLSPDGELGGGRGRILQWFWDHVEVERAGSTDSRWTQAIRVTSPPFPFAIEHMSA